MRLTNRTIAFSDDCIFYIGEVTISFRISLGNRTRREFDLMLLSISILFFLMKDLFGEGEVRSSSSWGRLVHHTIVVLNTVSVGQEISITFTGYGFQSAKSFPVN